MMINLSAVQLERDGLRSTMSAVLWDYSLKSEDVSLEVTENALMRMGSPSVRRNISTGHCVCTRFSGAPLG